MAIDPEAEAVFCLGLCAVVGRVADVPVAGARRIEPRSDPGRGKGGARGPFGKRGAADIAEAEEENRGGIWSIFAHIVRLRSKGEPTFNLRRAAARATTAT